MGAINQFERDTLSERTIDSLRAKKSQGVILGRPLANDVSAILDLYDSGKKAKEIAQETGININTVYHHIRKERKQMNKYIDALYRLDDGEHTIEDFELLKKLAKEKDEQESRKDKLVVGSEWVCVAGCDSKHFVYDVGRLS